jgi:ERCC4-type nuclease
MKQAENTASWKRVFPDGSEIKSGEVKDVKPEYVDRYDEIVVVNEIKEAGKMPEAEQGENKGQSEPGENIQEMEEAEGNEAFAAHLTQITYIGESLAEKIAADYNGIDDFSENVTKDYLTDLKGIGSEKADEIMVQLED